MKKIEKETTTTTTREEEKKTDDQREVEKKRVKTKLMHNALDRMQALCSELSCWCSTTKRKQQRQATRAPATMFN